jgi:TonB family protein
LVIPFVAALAVHAAILLGPGLPPVEPPSLAVDSGASSVELVFVEPVIQHEQPTDQAAEEPRQTKHHIPEFQSSQPQAVPLYEEGLIPSFEAMTGPPRDSSELDLPDIALLDEPTPEEAAPVETLVPSVESSGVEALNLEPSIGKPLEVKYPSLARRRGQEGVVVVRIHVGTQGEARDVELLQSSSYAQLDEAVMNAVKKHTFEPATRADIPVEGSLDFRVRFELK